MPKRVVDFVANVHKDGSRWLQEGGYLEESEIVIDLGDKRLKDAIFKAATESPFTIAVQALGDFPEEVNAVEVGEQATLF